MNSTMTMPTQTRRRKPEKRLGPLHEPAAFVDGPNQYQYVGGDPVGAMDPEGLVATRPTTTPRSKYVVIGGVDSDVGIENGSQYGTGRYVAEQLGIEVASGKVFGSAVGSGGSLWNYVPGHAVFFPLGVSELPLNLDAYRQGKRMRSKCAADDLINKRIALVMIAPRIADHKGFGGLGQGKFDSWVIWNPNDLVVNGCFIGALRDRASYWVRFAVGRGYLIAVQPAGGVFDHRMPGYVKGPSLLLQAAKSTWFGGHKRDTTAAYPGIGGVSRDLGPNGAVRGQYLDIKAMVKSLGDSPDYDYVFICHSQGCNIAAKFFWSLYKGK